MLLRNSWNWRWFNPLTLKKFTVLWICMMLFIFKAFVHSFSWCTMQRYFIKCEFGAAIACLLLTLQVFLFYLPLPSIIIPDMWTIDKENHLNIFFTALYKSLDLCVSFNGTKEAISSVTLYLSSISLIKWQLEPHLWRQCCIHRQSMKFKISSFTLQTAFHKFSNFFNLPGYSLVRQTDF